MELMWEILSRSLLIVIPSTNSLLIMVAIMLQLLCWLLQATGTSLVLTGEMYPTQSFKKQTSWTSTSQNGWLLRMLWCVTPIEWKNHMVVSYWWQVTSSNDHHSVLCWDYSSSDVSHSKQSGKNIIQLVLIKRCWQWDGVTVLLTLPSPINNLSSTIRVISHQPIPSSLTRRSTLCSNMAQNIWSVWGCRLKLLHICSMRLMRCSSMPLNAHFLTRWNTESLLAQILSTCLDIFGRVALFILILTSQGEWWSFRYIPLRESPSRMDSITCMWRSVTEIQMTAWFILLSLNALSRSGR